VKEVLHAWKKILCGRTPILSIEITRECPLGCPGCYAYNPEHLGGEVLLRQLADRKGTELVQGILRLVHQHRPSQVTLVGGEPLVRYRELNELLPQLAQMGISTQVVTSAVRAIPLEWTRIPRLNVCVSIDGLQPEHDQRRKPATYERILQNISGHQVTVHCTVTRQQAVREGYVEEFVKFWSAQPATKRIWISLYTPQVGELSEERLTEGDRGKVIQDLLRLRTTYAKLEMPAGVMKGYAEPARSPEECTFARLTQCISADLEKRITPCQFGGNPDCSQCGCMASAGLMAISRHRLGGMIRIGTLVEASLQIGKVARLARRSPRPKDREPTLPDKAVFQASGE
jgi:sulfatase maturation enzyme AslB (radical SAM superfamily)